MGDLLGKKEVSYRALSQEDIKLIENNATLLEGLEVPQLYDVNNPNSYIFIAMADGTENDLSDPSRYTNVANLFDELRDRYKNHPSIGFDYIEGVGTQDNKLVAKADAVFSFSFKKRANFLYEKFSEQAAAWLKENPNAEISIVQVGFSRGCGVSAYLNQKIHHEGVVDFDNKMIIDGKITYEKLIEPGAIKQAAVMFDPVLTNMDLTHHDFTLSISTCSVFQVNADNNEKRGPFPVTYFIKEGLSTNKNSICITMPGAHSDIGGSYKIDGLGKITRALQNSYLNALMGKNYFLEIEIPTNIKEYAIHNSVEHNPIYKIEIQEPRGFNNHINNNLDNLNFTMKTNKIDITSIQEFIKFYLETRYLINTIETKEFGIRDNKRYDRIIEEMREECYVEIKNINDIKFINNNKGIWIHDKGGKIVTKGENIKEQVEIVNRLIEAKGWNRDEIKIEGTKEFKEEITKELSSNKKDKLKKSQIDIELENLSDEEKKRVEYLKEKNREYKENKDKGITQEKSIKRDSGRGIGR